MITPPNLFLKQTVVQFTLLLVLLLTTGYSTAASITIDPAAANQPLVPAFAVLEMILLSLALAERINDMRESREQNRGRTAQNRVCRLQSGQQRNQVYRTGSDHCRGSPAAG